MIDKKYDSFSSAAFEAEVRETAYFLWEHAGRPEGQEEHYWFEALERCLRRRRADSDLQTGPAGKPDDY